MISLQNLTLRRGTQLLLQDTSFTIHKGQKIGVIGRNGAGKTSLFKLIMGELAPDGGEVNIPPDVRKAQMRQETAASARAALDHVIDGDWRYRELEASLREAEDAENYDRVAQLHAEVELIDGYTVKNRAEQLLSGLGFAEADHGKPVADFSGGWRIRLNLVQALMTPSDLLLLDEPTNHLDLEATLWLQQWLQRYEGSLLLISHDRAFLDEVVGHVVSFEGPELILYKGNYSAFEKQKAERLAQQQAIYEKQQQRRQEIEDFVRRFRAKASKARQAQSRLKELERMSFIEPAHVDSPFQFGFYTPDKLPESLLACSELCVGYDPDAPLIENFSLNVRPDSRIGLLGPNGRGKSTLLKVLTGQLAPLGGEINRHDYLRVGYMAQHQVDELDVNASPLQLLLRAEPKAKEQEARDFLGRFDFRGQRVDESIRPFSGGEKTRLALALVVWGKPNLLLLDEPTNHLDLEMRHALTMALQSFAGALIVVSHDRHLLNNTVDQFLRIRGRRLEHFDGDLHDYEKLLLESDREDGRRQAGGNDSGTETRADKKQSRQDAAEQRRRLKPLRDKVRKLERDLEGKQQRLAEVEEKLADTSLYDEANKDRLNQLLIEQGKLKDEVESLEMEWLTHSETLEQAAGDRPTH